MQLKSSVGGPILWVLYVGLLCFYSGGLFRVGGGGGGEWGLGGGGGGGGGLLSKTKFTGKYNSSRSSLVDLAQ
jgi:hypothetical protein